MNADPSSSSRCTPEQTDAVLYRRYAATPSWRRIMPASWRPRQFSLSGADMGPHNGMSAPVQLQYAKFARRQRNFSRQTGFGASTRLLYMCSPDLTTCILRRVRHGAVSCCVCTSILRQSC